MAQLFVTPDADPRWAMTPELRQALAGLHDLQLAEPAVAVPWPMILGILAGFLVVALTALYWWHRPRQQALRQLRQIRQIGQDRSSADGASIAVARLAGLLRQAAVSHAKPPMPVGLAGLAWLQWLDARAPLTDRGALLGEAGQCLLTLPYVPPSASLSARSRLPPDPSQVAELFELSERWLRSNC